MKPDPTKESSTQDLSPRFSGALDNFTPVKAGGAGVALSALNPKNLLLTVAGAAAIAETGIPAGQQAGAYAVLSARPPRAIDFRNSEGGLCRGIYKLDGGKLTLCVAKQPDVFERLARWYPLGRVAEPAPRTSAYL